MQSDQNCINMLNVKSESQRLIKTSFAHLNISILFQAPSSVRVSPGLTIPGTVVKAAPTAGPKAGPQIRAGARPSTSQPQLVGQSTVVLPARPKSIPPTTPKIIVKSPAVRPAVTQSLFTVPLPATVRLNTSVATPLRPAATVASFSNSRPKFIPKGMVVVRKTETASQQSSAVSRFNIFQFTPTCYSGNLLMTNNVLETGKKSSFDIKPDFFMDIML